MKYVLVLLTMAVLSCESVKEPLYGPCSGTDECGPGMTCIAADYGGDNGYCSWDCEVAVDETTTVGGCSVSNKCMAGCCEINHMGGGIAHSYCVPFL